MLVGSEVKESPLIGAQILGEKYSVEKLQRKGSAKGRGNSAQSRWGIAVGNAAVKQTIYRWSQCLISMHNKLIQTQESWTNHTRKQGYTHNQSATRLLVLDTQFDQYVFVCTESLGLCPTAPNQLT